MRRACIALSLLASSASTAGAQAPNAISNALASLSDDAPLVTAERARLVVHVHDDLEELGAPLGRSLTRRLDDEIELAGAPPGGLCVAVELGHACVAPLETGDDSGALVLMRGEDGRFYETEVVLPEGRAAAVRALAIAIVDVRDAARSAPLTMAPVVGATAMPAASGTSWVYVEREGGLFGRRRSIESIARPTIYLRALVGLTTARSTVLFGPGIGVGLCVGDFCAVLEGDIPIIEERRTIEIDPGEHLTDTISYRPVFVAARLGYRPLRAGPVTGGITWGLLDRFGNAWLGDTGESQLVNDLGMRQSLEVSIEISRPFEWVFEAGFDVTFAPARWTSVGQRALLLTDDVTGWGVTAIRIRP